MTATTVGRCPDVSYERWAATCDTLHAHAQVLGKLVAELAPPEPQLQHAVLHLTVRGWETAALPAPNGSGALAVVLDLRLHEITVEHSGGWTERIPLTPHRPVGHVTHEVLAAVARLGGPVPFQPRTAGGPLARSARRGQRARVVRARARPRLLQRSDPRSAGADGVQGAVPGTLDRGLGVVGSVRRGGQPLLR
jgi:hypothetical protein